MSPTETRLTEIETKLALAEDLIDTLNLTLFRQQEKLDQMQDQLRLLYARFQDLRDADASRPAASAADERPPHY
jgi:SlyX protein